MIPGKIPQIVNMILTINVKGFRPNDMIAKGGKKSAKKYLIVFLLIQSHGMF